MFSLIGRDVFPDHTGTPHPLKALAGNHRPDFLIQFDWGGRYATLSFLTILNFGWCSL